METLKGRNMSIITVKAYLYQGKLGRSDTEIRRFPWDGNGNFNVLQMKVSQVFPTLQKSGAKFSLFWKDPEGDYICFSSDDELDEAVTNAENNIFKIYLTVGKATTAPPPPPTEKPAEENREENDDGPNHPYIICDGCEGPVKGVRFKCSVCPDYDLCRKCKRQGKHPEHPMTAIKKPMAHGPWSGFFVNGRHFAPGPGGCQAPTFGPPPPPCGTEPGSGPHFSGPPPPFHGPWGRFFRRQMRRAWREQGKQQDKEGETKPGEEKEQNEEEEEGDYTPEEYLQNVGEQVAAMLDPLGIDVQVDVEHTTTKTGGCSKGRCRRPGDNAARGGCTRDSDGDGDWTVVTPGNSTPPETECPSNGIPLLEPKVAHALNQMKAMGFSDDGGWLSRLLIAKGGDIGQVLDALKPSLQGQTEHKA